MLRSQLRRLFHSSELDTQNIITFTSHPGCQDLRQLNIQISLVPSTKCSNLTPSHYPLKYFWNLPWMCNYVNKLMKFRCSIYGLKTTSCSSFYIEDTRNLHFVSYVLKMYLLSRSCVQQLSKSSGNNPDLRNIVRCQLLPPCCSVWIYLVLFMFWHNAQAKTHVLPRINRLINK